MKLLTIKFIILILSNNSYANNCIKKVLVEHKQIMFSANPIKPSITHYLGEKYIQISCDEYERLNVGDTLYAEKKDIKYGSFPFIPQKSKNYYRIIEK